MPEKKYVSFERLTEYDNLIKNKILEGDDTILTSSKSYTDEKFATFTMDAFLDDDGVLYFNAIPNGDGVSY